MVGRSAVECVLTSTLLMTDPAEETTELISQTNPLAVHMLTSHAESDCSIVASITGTDSRALSPSRMNDMVWIVKSVTVVVVVVSVVVVVIEVSVTDVRV